MNPEVNFVISRVDDYNYLVDVVLSGVPKNFLGTAFHLKLSGMKWRLDNYVLGGALRAPDRRMILVGTKKATTDCSTDILNSDGSTQSQIYVDQNQSKSDQELIFGFSNKFGQDNIVQDGVLVTFQISSCAKTPIKTGTLIKPTLSRQVYSEIDNQLRIDLKNVNWNLENFTAQKIAKQVSDATTESQNGDSGSFLGYGSSENSGFDSVTTLQTDQIVPLNAQASVLTGGLDYGFLFMFLVTILLASAGGYLLYRWLR